MQILPFPRSRDFRLNSIHNRPLDTQQFPQPIPTTHIQKAWHCPSTGTFCLEQWLTPNPSGTSGTTGLPELTLDNNHKLSHTGMRYHLLQAYIWDSGFSRGRPEGITTPVASFTAGNTPAIRHPSDLLALSSSFNIEQALTTDLNRITARRQPSTRSPSGGYEPDTDTLRKRAVIRLQGYKTSARSTSLEDISIQSRSRVLDLDLK